MKKLTSAFIMLMLILSLAACGETAKNVDSKDAASPKKDDKSNLTLAQVFQKSLDASKNVKSMSGDMDLTQKIQSGEQAQPINSTSHIEMDVLIQKPMSMHQKMSIQMDGNTDANANQSYETETYLTKDGFFMYDPTQQKWMKMPKEFSDQILQMSDYQTNPGEELKKLQQYADDFSFEQDHEHFILKLNASGDKFNSLIQDSMKNLPEQLKGNEENLKNIKFNKVNYEIYINKETFLTDSLNVTTDMEMNVNGQSVNVNQEIKGAYKNYNKISTVEVPQDVLDNAQEVQF
ncbi:DUF6612 family protein [Falsibacillus albus]|uniref:Lipoprotein n=1 Tax=Falsibacillus albus TaxID=2478915 RepID=A0A3L7K473_9BACI|nr:DUF6612 family protein [Falsibacillus albus]RLQ97853.1 hypothetical protein D9X91_00200 [Falsibacillus albus]